MSALWSVTRLCLPKGSAEYDKPITVNVVLKESRLYASTILRIKGIDKNASSVSIQTSTAFSALARPNLPLRCSIFKPLLCLGLQYSSSRKLPYRGSKKFGNRPLVPASSKSLIVPTNVASDSCQSDSTPAQTLRHRRLENLWLGTDSHNSLQF